MQSFTRSAAASARRLRLQSRLQQQRHASHEHGPPQAHVAGPREESFGRGFFIGILCIPAALLVYSVSRPGQNGEQPFFSRYISKLYVDYAKQNEERNTLHTDAIEQAAADRLLFLNEGSLQRPYARLRHIEQVNNGSPFNVPAGRGYANMDALIEKYQKEAYEQNAEKLQQIKDNKVPVEQPFSSSFTKTTPAAADS